MTISIIKRMLNIIQNINAIRNSSLNQSKTYIVKDSLRLITKSSIKHKHKHSNKHKHIGTFMFKLKVINLSKIYFLNLTHC